MVESEIIGQGSVVGAMKGKYYNRSVYCHKVASEALHRLQFEAFLNHIDEGGREDVKAVAHDLLTKFSSGSLER